MKKKYFLKFKGGKWNIFNSLGGKKTSLSLKTKNKLLVKDSFFISKFYKKLFSIVYKQE